MSVVESPSTIVEEVVELMAGNPSRQELLDFRPSNAAQSRARELLARLQDDSLTEEERRELDQFQNIELLMRLLKARLRAPWVGKGR